MKRPTPRDPAAPYWEAMPTVPPVPELGDSPLPPSIGMVARVREAARRRPLVLIAIGVFCYSMGPVMVSASNVAGPVLSFYRLWFGVLAFGFLSAVHIRRTGRRPERAGLMWALKAGVAFGVHQLMFMTAIKATSVVDVTLMSSLSPVIVGVLAVPMFNERTGVPFRLWSAVAIAGSALVVVAGSSGPDGDLGGMMLAATNVFFFALFFMFSKQGREHIDVVPFLFGVMTVAAFTVSAFVVVTGEAVGSVDGESLLLAAGIAFVPGLVGHFVMTWPLRWVPANIPPVMRLATPFIAGLTAWALLGQTIGGAEVLAGLLTLAGVFGAVLSPAGRRLAEEAAVEVED